MLLSLKSYKLAYLKSLRSHYTFLAYPMKFCSNVVVFSFNFRQSEIKARVLYISKTIMEISYDLLKTFALIIKKYE